MTVYMVTTGEYSDYRVRGIFSTRDKAEAFIETHRTADPKNARYDDPWDIDERELDEYDSQEYVKVYSWCTDSEGRTSDESYESFEWKPKGWRGEAEYADSFPYHSPKYWHCSAESAVSAEHAKKLVIEKLQEVQRQQALTK